MKIKPDSTKKKRSVKKIILRIIAVFILLLSGVAVFLYFNFNRLLSDALRKSFASSVISDVYELKFEKLSVNFLVGNISVHNVDLQPRAKPLNNYPYINSSFHLKTDKILLGNVKISSLLKENILKLDRIELDAPGIDFTIADVIPVFFPFKDSAASADKEKKNNKKSIESFFLKEFSLTDASFHVTNSAKQREFNIQQINISLQDLLINQTHGMDIISYKEVDLSVGKFTGDLKKKSLKHLSFKDFKIKIDALKIQQTRDTIIFKFADFSTGVKEVDIQTADSIFHLSVASFDLSYKEKSIKFQEVSFKPNISESAIQAGFPYQHTQFSGTFGSLELAGINFDSLIYSKKILINKITIDKVSASVFKDKTKPMDYNKFPVYLGQSIKAIPIPLSIKEVKVTNINLVNRELKPEGTYATANIKRGTADIKHITNQSSGEMLMKADAYIENKAHFYLTLKFNYQEPQFSFDGKIEKFNLPNLNPLIQSYTPANIKKGTLDDMEFSGFATRTNSSGIMKFLYHDLDIDLALKEKAHWKSAVLTFAANTVLPAANPSSDKPARIVQFHVERDLNKSFVNLVIKSLLSGLKETMIMSKENKKDYKAEKKEAKKEARKERKKNKN